MSRLVEYKETDGALADDIVGLADEFNNQISLVVFSYKRAYQILENSRQPDSDFFVLLLLEGNDLAGLLVGVCTTPAFSEDRFAAEIGWYIAPEHRGKYNAANMVQLFEDWAESKGASFVAMTSQRKSDKDPSKLYEILGYSPGANFY